MNVSQRYLYCLLFNPCHQCLGALFLVNGFAMITNPLNVHVRGQFLQLQTEYNPCLLLLQYIDMYIYIGSIKHEHMHRLIFNRLHELNRVVHPPTHSFENFSKRNLSQVGDEFAIVICISIELNIIIINNTQVLR